MLAEVATILCTYSDALLSRRSLALVGFGAQAEQA